MPSKNPTIKKAYKDGMITKNQYDKLSDGLLLGIINKKKKSKKPTTSKGMERKTGRLAYEKGKGKKETRKKVGKEAHKRGRPKGGSKVEVVS